MSPSLCCDGINAEISALPNLSVIFSARSKEAVEKKKKGMKNSGNGWKEVKLLFWLYKGRTNFQF